ncbi:ATP-binding protein [Bradyrhizobium sp. LjRoot220]|uniref:hypothetical protein n=1 Tax=Bradyrhizobium sp. LjRoot220 TaxID=3342284 RepID=UPI003ECF4028
MLPLLQLIAAQYGTRMNDAAGFSLTIANAIVLAHRGASSLHEREPHGMVVRIELPVHQQSKRSAAYLKRQAASESGWDSS